MRDNSNDVAKIFEGDGDNERAQSLKSEAYAYQVAIWLLSDDNNSFEEYGKIQYPKEFEK